MGHKNQSYCRHLSLHHPRQYSSMIEQVAEGKTAKLALSFATMDASTMSLHLAFASHPFGNIAGENQ
uniref:Uncharacterized protein n=1 Tax=Arundo donax TaxID=35708 RepID=A0A0A9EFW3_ARUDO